MSIEQRPWGAQYYGGLDILRNPPNSPQNVSHWVGIKFNRIKLFTENSGHTPAVHSYGQSRVCIGISPILPPDPSRCGLPRQPPVFGTETVLAAMKLPWYLFLDDSVLNECTAV